MESNKTLEKLLEQIKLFLKNKNTYEGWFYNYDQNYDFIVKYKIEDINIWKVDNDKLCNYEGYMSVKVNELWVGISEDDEWERSYGWDDIPETSWDDVKDDILDLINKFLPQICVDIHFTS